MKYKAIIFDLDGTLIDSLEDIGESLNNVLQKYRLPTHLMKDYIYFIGEGVKTLIKKALPNAIQDDILIEQILEGYRNEYAANCLNKTHLYPGIEELLNNLTEQKVKLTVFSNKPDEFTQIVCNHYLKNWHFDLIIGQRDDIPRKPDPKGALEIVKLLDLKVNEVLYIGDSMTDIETAQNANIHVAAVTWGFRTRIELEAQHPDYVIDKPEEILKIIYNPDF